ncbi:plasma-membrane proton-efflux P-type ATPase [Lichtheimia ornata]|uniref:Plasma membrane ATPase n=1 Tax=Lichtheimia ornata TaxID=688661 RepID=A0AAD7V454_9FUNG|nr:plasma-membrane proton-efflux P-type ATPase [Lichtheimia ornata]KAJ8658544.1 plasma-membrane proton-efflux P-type ATPase [Lichtheimia ornata]
MAEKIEQPETATKQQQIDGNITSLTVEELYDKDKYDLSTMELEDVTSLLQTTKEGLTSDEAARRIEKFGPNKLVEKETNAFLQFLSFMWNPLSWVMEAAAIVSIAVANGEGKPPDYPDFIGIVLLLLANSLIGFYEERQAGNAVKALMESLAPECKVKRNGEWHTMEAAELVPGDVIAIKLGDVVPADGRLLAAHGQVSIDQAALTGESLPVGKESGDEIFSGSTVKQGEAEAIVTGTGLNTFFGRAAKLVGEAGDDVGHLQTILTKIGNFCLCTIGLFVVIEILVMYAAFRYNYRRGIDNLLVLLIGGIPIAMPTVLSVTLAIGAKQLAEHKAIVTRITAIEEMAAVTILCSDKTGTLTLNKLIVDKPTIKTYAEFNGDEVIQLSAFACRTENQDAIDFCIVNSLPDPKLAREGIEELEFKPFNPVIKRTEITYRVKEDGSVRRVTKGMSHTILDLCTRDKTEEQIKALNDDVDEFARRGLRALAVAVDEVPSGEVEGEGKGMRLIGLLPIYDPPRSDTKETIDRSIALGVQVKMITGDQLAIGKETGRRLGMGDNMFLSKTLKDGPPPGSGYTSIDDMVLQADGFAGVYPEHKYEIVERLQNLGHMTAMTGDGVNDAPALSKANVGVAVADASDAARSAADIVLTEPGLSVIVEAIIGSRQIFQRMRNYAIYACSITIRVVIGFAILCFAFQHDFPPFPVLIIAVLNDGTIMTISTDRVKPSPYPDAWNLKEIFMYAIVYGLYQAASTLAFAKVAFHTTFFNDKFGVELPADVNDHIYHSIIYLQVSIMSQALIFITRSRSWFFMERPSVYLMCAFVIAQLVATFIAVYANWGFTYMRGCGWDWAGIVWIWNFIWFLPMDFCKFAMQYFFTPKNTLKENKTPMAGTSSRRASAVSGSGSGRYYANRTKSLKSLERPRNFGSRLLNMNKKMSMDQKEMRRFSSAQTNQAAQVLNSS